MSTTERCGEVGTGWVDDEPRHTVPCALPPEHSTPHDWELAEELAELLTALLADAPLAAGVTVASATASQDTVQLDVHSRYGRLRFALEVSSIAGPAEITYTDPEVLDRGVREGWADPQTDPADIDWAERIASAAITYAVVDGRPISPFPPTTVRHGRNGLGRWGESRTADALVTVSDGDGQMWLLMIERGDGTGWALPGGFIDPGETPAEAASRELREETTVEVAPHRWQLHTPRHVPDPRASDEAWVVTTLARCYLGVYLPHQRPVAIGADDARRAVWVRANNYPQLCEDLDHRVRGQVFAAHQQMLAEALDGAR